MQTRGAIPRVLVVILSSAVAGLLGASTVAAASPPSQSQIRHAVRAAERSPSLWATINICNTTRHPHELGIRGQMPALAFPTHLYMTIEAEYRPAGGHRFLPDPGTKKRLFVGRTSNSLHQAGVTFKFKQHTVLAGAITFVWKLKGKTIGRVRRITTGRHTGVKYADPRGHSAAVCVMK